MSYDANNVFAKILRGEAQAHVVYEDAHTLAFMDLMPQTEGHTLVVPREHAEGFFDISPEALTHTIRTTQRVARAVKTAFDAKGVMILQLNGREAGQSVFHLHFHIVPRNAGLDLKLHARQVADPQILAEHATRIRNELGAD